MQKDKMTVCKHCGQEIAASAKVCPHCGGKNKPPIYKRWWFIAIIVLIIFAAIGGSSSSSDSTNSSSKASSDVAIDYTPYSVTELSEDLDANALKASDKYKGQYISIVDSSDDWAILGVQCSIKTDEQKQAVMDFALGDEIIVKGKITNVGEVLGYYLDMTEVPTKAN